ncbi:hypothetical protein GCM10023211_08810 [Orbus sasakiae]|uniref:SMEK domain-containing protein n=1 Tax=Orbus sasakiae TaxID=1078475 RepID=A0ABP9N2B8_9GAMM
MTKLELLQRSSTLLGRFAHGVKTANAMGLFDINTVAEDFFIPIFAITFNSPDLCNQNRIKMNFPAVDLGCKTSRISIQITSDSSSNKVCETLEKFESHSLGDNFDCLYVYVITERQKSYISEKLTETVANLSIEFDPSHNILDFKDLAKMFKGLSDEQLRQINAHLEAEFKKVDANLQFRNNLDEFLSVSQQKIEDEKLAKKYISSVFVETSETKEDMRYFANPMFFYRKIDDDIQRVDLAHLNKLLAMVKVEPIAENWHEISTLEVPNSLLELRERLIKQNTALEAIKGPISLFSWDVDRAERFVPNANLSGYWDVFQHAVQSNGSGVLRLLKDISKKIRLTQVKIFLVTGMAGQGKTNFVCDLVENQYKAFEIPTIFIPARLLNDYPSPNRILSYITNNRFAPDVANLHALFTLLDNVAKECQKPFVIAIDGINEVGDLDGFVSELRVFLEALCQYDFLKIVITCRNEFFDHKFAGVFEPQFSAHLYRVRDLRGEMSDTNKSRLLNAYLTYFQIQVSLSKNATEFLKNDLILLRIFSEIHKGKNIGCIANIYKGDIFEKYLVMKVEEFPTSLKQKVLKSLYKICSRMLDEENFSQIALDGFDDNERQILERLIGEDIILRREVPSTGLASLGIENISFTYDELRDFLLAYYIVIEFTQSNPEKVDMIFEKISDRPIYEGFFRYAYVLARKHKNEKILTICESSPDFIEHYLNNLSLLSANIQTHEDVVRIETILRDSTDRHDIQRIAWFLLKKREDSEHFNIRILLNHVNKLDDESAEQFFDLMFSRYFESDWRGNISGFLLEFNELKEDQKLGLGSFMLAFVLYLVPYARWNEREITLNYFDKFQLTPIIIDTIELCKSAVSKKVQACLKEISKDREEL